MAENIIPFPPRPGDVPDAEQCFVDHNGVEWFKFLCEYAHDGDEWSFEIWAMHREDAAARLLSMAATAKVTGQVFAKIPS